MQRSIYNSIQVRKMDVSSVLYPFVRHTFMINEHICDHTVRGTELLV